MDAQLITSIVALVISLIAVYVVTTVRNQILAAVELVKQLVVTKNAMTLGEMGDATETRRIDAIPPEDRTVAENQHVHDAPLPDDQPQGD